MLQISVSRRHLVVFTAVIAVLVLVGWVVMSDRASAATSQFDDVPDGNVFVADINWLADAGVTRGCNPPANTKYCPSDYVTREQMSAFMHRLSGGDSRTIDGRLEALEVGGGVPSDDLATLEAAVAALTIRLDIVESKVGTLEAENAELQEMLAGVSRDGSTLLFTGMNLQVVNGTGSTDISNSLGNLIIGYNERSDSYPYSRVGSHYLVVGPHHSWTAVGGIVAGYFNTASGDYASVTGGYQNSASGFAASVSGGIDNTASGDYASVTGGDSGSASGYGSVVTGGYTNHATGHLASVSGGQGNIASGSKSAVSGGYDNNAGPLNVVIGGDAVTCPDATNRIICGEGYLTLPD